MLSISRLALQPLGYVTSPWGSIMPLTMPLFLISNGTKGILIQPIFTASFPIITYTMLIAISRSLTNCNFGLQRSLILTFGSTKMMSNRLVSILSTSPGQQPWKKWKISRGAEPMEVDNPSDWSLVKPRGRSRNNSPRPTPDLTPNNIAVTADATSSTASTSEMTTYGATISPDTTNNPPPTSTTSYCSVEFRSQRSKFSPYCKRRRNQTRRHYPPPN